MFNKVLQLLHVRCAHKKLSQPFAATPSNHGSNSSDWDAPAPPTKHYVVCLDCGHKIEYDWVHMRVVGK